MTQQAYALAASICRSIRGMGVAMVCVMLGACATSGSGADAQAERDRLAALTAGRFAHQEAVPKGISSDEAWWTQMGPGDLSRWVEAALRSNTDLRAALERVAQAKAQAGIVSASRLPSVNASGSFGQTQGGALAMGTLGTQNGATRDQLALQMNYEFDFWGRREFSIESALQQIRSAEYGYVSFQMSLAAEVAATYFRALALRERQDIIRTMVAMARKNADDIRKKMALGEATQVMLSQQMIFEQSLLAQEQDLLLQHDQAINQLALLTGVRPAQVQLAPARLQETRLPDPHMGLPSELLCRRPDLRQAQANLRAAQADVDVARTLLLPGMSLGLIAGQISPGLSGLTAGARGFLQSSLLASQAIFDGGARKQGIALSESRRRELVERYASAILAALRDTENALVGVQKSTEKVKWLESNSMEARKLASMMLDMLEKGGVDFVQMMQIQTSVYSAEDAAVSGMLDRILSQIELYKALGGSAGMAAKACDSTENRP